MEMLVGSPCHPWVFFFMRPGTDPDATHRSFADCESDAVVRPEYHVGRAMRRPSTIKNHFKDRELHSAADAVVRRMLGQ